MKFTIVMASTMANYSTAAKDRETKIIRAIGSVLQQTHKDWELLIVADGCNKTIEIVERSGFDRMPNIRLALIAKNPLFSGGPRNFGIANAKGEWITYLDIDDILGPDHLKIIADEILLHNAFPETGIAPKWLFYNDWISLDNRKWVPSERKCKFNELHKHGTSNITHRRDLNVYWRMMDDFSDVGGPKKMTLNEAYRHDHFLIEDLVKKAGPPAIIATPQYYVMHVPPKYDL